MGEPLEERVLEAEEVPCEAVLCEGGVEAGERVPVARELVFEGRRGKEADARVWVGQKGSDDGPCGGRGLDVLQLLLQGRLN